MAKAEPNVMEKTLCLAKGSSNWTALLKAVKICMQTSKRLDWNQWYWIMVIW